MLRHCVHYTLTLLCLMTYGWSWAQTTIWVVAPDSGAAYREVIDAMQAEVGKPASFQWIVSRPDALRAPDPAPRVVVAVGNGAVASVLAYYKDKPGVPPIVATLLPRRAYERELLNAGSGLKTTAVFLDQSPSRQAALIQAAFPRAKQIGLLVGADSQSQVESVSTALAAAGLTVSVGDVRAAGLLPALQSVMEGSDVLLGLADPSVFNGESITSILTAGYRRRVPLVAFSPAYVKAGALIGLYASPAQIGKATGSVVQAVVGGRALPPPKSAAEFSIDVNAAVARSMGFVINATELQKQIIEKGPSQ
jgi:putative ABC transport system substrate-binding protein